MKESHARPSIRAQLCAVAALAGLAAGCVQYERRSSPITPTSASALVGTWASSATGSSGACGNFRWQLTDQTGTSASGTFTATCTGGVQLDGTLTATLADSTIKWTAAGTATSPSLPPCPFTLGGTAVPESDLLRVNYSGSTCLGSLSGTEVLRR